MGGHFLDGETYEQLLRLLDNQHFTDRAGEEGDMRFLTEDWWLRDTAVIENLMKRDGLWEIQLVFAHYREPYKLIKRCISRYSSREKAMLSACYMRRLAAKDQRGTLQVRIEDFGLCES